MTKEKLQECLHQLDELEHVRDMLTHAQDEYDHMINQVATQHKMKFSKEDKKYDKLVDFLKKTMIAQLEA
jgi:hypothetical protein